ncbi:hypothetical protein RIF29_29131 [Crotalaria pallida]|uniref:Uncharacterized protein n=1 Tax=Crotalaria pallida TaxID=3830 RepID=A0AAN9HVM5_CROPI
MNEEKEGSGEAEVDSHPLMHKPSSDSLMVYPEKPAAPTMKEMPIALKGKEVVGGERKIAWKKLARKSQGASPAISPNSGLKRKDVGNVGDAVPFGECRQGVAQKLKLMLDENGGEVEAARTGAQSRRAQ